MTEQVVLFDEIKTTGGKRFGVATLNAPASLNSLSVAMVRLLTPKLREWAQDPSVAGVLLQAAGEKAFCAGGDLRQLYQTLLECGPARNTYAEDFFREEYVLDHLIHTFPKPLLCWGHGIVMGGGVGLMAGASHRVVTPQSRVAMPEINIGLYPDVGGSWFLRRMPGRVGLYLALTAAPLNAADAIFCGLADLVVPQERKAQLLEAIAAATWHAEPAADRATLSRLLAQAGQGVAHQPSKVREHFDAINELMAGDDLLDIAKRLRALQSQDPWLQGAAQTFTKGSPSSAALSFALWQRVPRMSLAEVFRLEYRASLGFCAHKDFAEGIRALLIEKDRNPKWNPATLEEITPEFVEDHLRPRGDMPPELAALI
ncbi:MULTISPECIES: enoyl-CoA hydratase/isomerase family protein [unclassified Variovorax]|uniref:enoyl-CoA hydratase/isomerase family protein n=1 Tax=unclassified Variovorax TaxID=663243 RepID=UPI00076BC5D0|nr:MULTISPECIES: enoyl-CoA hydratase/isomerase family protein [unclassified Variovorax]KWT82835.1 3-hydroxyisobutyryl-CoA hydrolase [Variovorax sp. WDL1]PNG52424.1 Short-chain-enoyl-CoA hydratase [Variovorax sp. B4]PNG54964.1 Short-chain-enoyl-CoA hydratase [Variovorax sp. B2]VTV15985.1 putative enoyl-CoA hydratase echA8 [Variovorax sp. WDL1]